MPNLTVASSSFLNSAKRFPISPSTKRPIFAGWQTKATSDPAQIAEWGREFPGCAWAIACAESGLIGVDVDPKARKIAREPDSEQAGFGRAMAAWRDLCASWGSPILTPHVRSRSGGFHVYFRPPAGADAKDLVQRGLVKLPGWQQHVIETRVNGFLLVPPSEFEGRAYAMWSDEAPYEAPAALIEALRKVRVQPGNAPPDAIVKPGTYDVRSFAKYICNVHHKVGLPRDVWRAAIFAMVAQYGRHVAYQIAHAIHDGESDTTFQIDDLISRASETFSQGDATFKTLFGYAHRSGIRDVVQKSTSEMFGMPSAP